MQDDASPTLYPSRRPQTPTLFLLFPPDHSDSLSFQYLKLIPYSLGASVSLEEHCGNHNQEVDFEDKKSTPSKPVSTTTKKRRLLCEKRGDCLIRIERERRGPWTGSKDNGNKGTRNKGYGMEDVWTAMCGANQQEAYDAELFAIMRGVTTAL